MDKEYIEKLEKHIEELEDIVATHNPTTLNILNLLIEQKRVSYEKNKIKFGQNLSDLHLFKEICTIKFNLGRQMGHTTALRTIYNKDPLTTMYIMPRKTMLANFHGGLAIDELASKLQGCTFTKKLILADCFLGQAKSDDMINTLYDTIIGRIVSQGTPPIFVIT
jgi:hypothetical protein